MAKQKQARVKLEFDDRNANTHTERSYDAVRKSVSAFGAGNGIVADSTGKLIGGEATLKAAQALNLPIRQVHTNGDELVCIVRSDLLPDDQRRRALALALNQTAKLSDFGEESLIRELQAVEDEGLRDAIGFSADELSDLLDPDDEPAAVFPDLPPSDEPAISRPGDLWTLGDHRLCYGDSTKAEDVDRLMEGQKAALFFSDPPYGVSYKGVMNADGTPSKTGGWNDIASDNLRDDDLIQNLLLPAFRQAVRVSQDDAAFYIWHASTTRRDFEFALQSAGLQERQYLIWVKPTMVMGHSDYHYQHEPVFYCNKAGHKPKWTGDRTQTTVWRITNVPSGGTVSIANGLRITNGQGAELFVQLKAPKAKKLRLIRLRSGEQMSLTTGGCTDCWEVELDPKSEVQHPTQKPAELACRAIRNHCDRGNVVLDLFSGSASTLMGCEATGMRARACDIDPRYVDLGVIRWQEKTGQQAVRHDGVTFNELLEARDAE